MGYFAEAKIGNICIEIKDKGDFGVIPYLEIGNINVKTKNYSFEEKASVKGCKIAQKGDTLVSRVRPTRGAIAVVKEEKLFVSNAFTVLRPIKPISSRIIWYYLAWNQEFLSYLGANCTGSLYPTVSDKVIVDYSIPLPPLNEQKRIVAKLDQIMPRIDAVKERLDKVPAIVKRFRQSVLTAAVTGKLTEKWREEHGIIDEWKEVSLDAVIPKGGIFDGPFGSNLKTSDYTNKGVRVIRLENIGHLFFIHAKETYVTKEKYNTLIRHTVGEGDIIFSSFIADEIRACILTKIATKAIAKADCFCVRPDESKIDKSFLLYSLVSFDSYHQLVLNIHGATRPRINTTQLKTLLIPYPPLEEQKEIVRQVEKFFALADRLESHYQKAKSRVDKLSQSVLAKAFRGELVITEAELAEKEGRDFESAEKLLERILEEKAKIAKPLRKNK